MTLNRITVTLTTLIAALFALLVIAGLVGDAVTLLSNVDRQDSRHRGVF